MDASFKAYLAEFLTEALAGSLINYFRRQEETGREEILQNLLLILKAGIPSILLAKAAEAR